MIQILPSITVSASHYKMIIMQHEFCNDTLSFTSVHFRPSFKGQSHAQPGRGMFSSDHCGQVSGHL